MTAILQQSHSSTQSLEGDTGMAEKLTKQSIHQRLASCALQCGGAVGANVRPLADVDWEHGDERHITAGARWCSSFLSDADCRSLLLSWTEACWSYNCEQNRVSRLTLEVSLKLPWSCRQKGDLAYNGFVQVVAKTSICFFLNLRTALTARTTKGGGSLDGKGRPDIATVCINDMT